MSAARLAIVRELFDRAAALPPAVRARLLEDKAIAADVRDEVSALLASIAAHDDPIAARIADAAAATVPGEPARIGPWRVCGVLGEGGMGVVLLGERDDGQFTQRVAIKRLRGFAGKDTRERLLRERRLLAQLDHPHIARLLDGGTTPDGEPYLVMQLVEGRQLSAWASESAPTLRQRVVAMLKVCRAVHHAHQHLIVHRDLKPDNIMVRADGEPALLDFGIAKLFDATDGAGGTATHHMTPAYASPEQLAGRPVTTASDVFALGVVLYELLSGARAPRGDGAIDEEHGVPPPSRAMAGGRDDANAVRGDLDRIVRKATRRDATERYSSAEALAADLAAWLDGLPISAAAPNWRYLAGKYVRRHRAGVAITVVALASILALSLLLWRQNLATDASRIATAREAATADAAALFLQGLFAEIDPMRHPGRRLGAIELLDIGRERLDAMVDARPTLRASIALRLAELYGNAGRPDRALELARSAQAAISGNDVPAELDRDLRLSLLTSEYRLSQWTAASDIADGLLADVRATGDRATEARVLMVQGRIAQGVSKPGVAEASYEAALVVYRAMGSEGLDGVDSVGHARAQLAQDQGQFPLALERYRATYDARRKRLGEDHPDTIDTQIGMAVCLNFLGRTADAHAIYADALERTKRVFGPRSEATANAMIGAASADRRLGRYGEAEAGYRDAIAFYAEINAGADNVDSADQHANLARVRQDLGDLDGAEALNATALRMRTELFGGDSPWVALAWQNLADFRLDADDVAGAREALAHALRIRRAQFAPRHFLRLISEATQVTIDARSGNRDAALAAVAPLRDALPEAPFNTRVVILEALAAAAAVQPDPAARIAALEEQVQLLRQRHPESHPLLAIARLRLAEAQADAGHVDNARRQLRAASQVIDATNVASSPWRARAQHLGERLR